MRYAEIKDNKVINIIESEEDFAEEMKWIFVGSASVCIGDEYLVDHFFRKGEDGSDNNIYPDIKPNSGPTPAQIRKFAYNTMIVKSNGDPLINWENENLTVDTANLVCLNYIAEGNEQYHEIQLLIAAAKEYIRQLYPDIEIV